MCSVVLYTELARLVSSCFCIFAVQDSDRNGFPTRMRKWVMSIALAFDKKSRVHRRSKAYPYDAFVHLYRFLLLLLFLLLCCFYVAFGYDLIVPSYFQPCVLVIFRTMRSLVFNCHCLFAMGIGALIWATVHMHAWVAAKLFWFPNASPDMKTRMW